MQRVVVHLDESSDNEREERALSSPSSLQTLRVDAAFGPALTSTTATSKRRRPARTPEEYLANEQLARLKAEEKERLKEQARHERDVERQRKLEEREVLKQQKQEAHRLEKERKQRFIDANKRSVKADVVQELIVDIDSHLISGTAADVSLSEAVPLLEELGCVVNVTSLARNSSVQWRRRVQRIFDQEKQMWVPLATDDVFVQTESSAVLHVMSGVLFAQSLLGLNTSSLAIDYSSIDADVHSFKTMYPQQRCIYLVEGLEKWKRSEKAKVSRRYKAQMNNPTTELISALPTLLTTELLEDAIVYLQIAHHMTVILTKDRMDTISAIVSYTSEIATLPYNQQQSQQEHNFCTDVTLQSGADDAGTWKAMLLSISLCSIPVALAIMRKYPTVMSLYDAYFCDLRNAPLLLENLELTIHGMVFSFKQLQVKLNVLVQPCQKSYTEYS